MLSDDAQLLNKIKLKRRFILTINVYKLQRYLLKVCQIYNVRDMIKDQDIFLKIYDQNLLAETKYLIFDLLFLAGLM